MKDSDLKIAGQVTIAIGEWEGKVVMKFEKHVECVTFSVEAADKLVHELSSVVQDLRKIAVN